MERITLRSDRFSAEILTRGAQLASFRGPDGREHIWQADPAIWPSHGPVLFPVCGSVADGRILYNGKACPMQKHGFAKDADFTVTRRGDDFAELTLLPTPESRAMYPFAFSLHVLYTLEKNGLSVRYIVENRGKKPMPFCIGGHPSFAVPMEEDAAFEDYQLIFDEVEEGKNWLAPGGGLIDGFEYLENFRNAQVLPLDHRTFDLKDSLLFVEPRSRGVNLVNQNTGRGLRIEFPKMEVLVLWTMAGKNGPYLCVEPWHGMPEKKGESGELAEKPFATVLESGMSWQGGYTVAVL